MRSVSRVRVTFNGTYTAASGYGYLYFERYAHECDVVISPRGKRKEGVKHGPKIMYARGNLYIFGLQMSRAGQSFGSGYQLRHCLPRGALDHTLNSETWAIARTSGILNRSGVSKVGPLHDRQYADLNLRGRRAMRQICLLAYILSTCSIAGEVRCAR
jgi:hypothetical protein